MSLLAFPKTYALLFFFFLYVALGTLLGASTACSGLSSPTSTDNLGNPHKQLGADLTLAVPQLGLPPQVTAQAH